jgi:hypothetical protein
MSLLQRSRPPLATDVRRPSPRTRRLRHRDALETAPHSCTAVQRVAPLLTCQAHTRRRESRSTPACGVRSAKRRSSVASRCRCISRGSSRAELSRRDATPIGDVDGETAPRDQALAALELVRASIDELDDIAGRLARSANQLGGSWRDIASSLRLTEDAARRAYDRPRASQRGRWVMSSSVLRKHWTAAPHRPLARRRSRKGSAVALSPRP